MLYVVLLLLAIVKHCLPQPQPQGADMPLNLPPQLDNIGPGVGIKRHPGQPPALFVDAPIDTGGGQTQFVTGGELPQFGMDGGGGVPPIDSARNMISPVGGVSQTGGQVIGTGGIVSAGHMIDPGAGVVSHIDQGGQLGIDAAGAFMGGPIIPDIGVQPGTGAQPMMVDTGALLSGQAGVLDVPQGHGQGGLGGHVAKSECTQLIDIMFVLDSSDSINRKDFKKLRWAIGNTTQTLDLSQKGMHMGWVVFSTTVGEVQHLSFDKKLLKSAARKIIHQRDGTMTNLAIREMIKEFERNGRPGVPRVGFVISDGISKLRAETLQEAKLARDSGIAMFAIGVGLTDNTELHGIASGPDKVVSLADFDSLRAELETITKQICPCPEIKVKWLPPGVILEPGTRTIGSVRKLMCEKGLQGVGVDFLECKKNSMWSQYNFACKACPMPMPEYGNARLKPKLHPDRPYLVGDMVEYICYDGYIIPTAITATCGPGPNGPIWSDLVGQCAVCAPPKNDYLDMTLDPTGTLTVGSRRHYTCHKGLVPSGPIEIACIDVNGIPQWDGPIHSCIGCGPAPLEIGLAHIVDPVYGPGMPIMKGGGAYIGEERYYKCKQGYVETGPIQIVCLADKWATRWSIPEHSCTACLNEPPPLPNAELIIPGGQLIGDVRIYKCLHGYMVPGRPDGTIETVCEVSKGLVGWRTPAHGCIACEEPLKIPPHTILDINSPKDTKLGTFRKYICQEGFIQTGPITMGCVAGPTGPMWTPPEFICITCDAPPKLPNAFLEHEHGNNAIGSIRRYTCDPGYLPIGPGKITVECFGKMTGENGIAIWGPPSDVCHGCPDPPSMIGNAELVGGSNLVGGTMKYKCIDKYQSIGPVEIKCLPTGTWSDPQYTCSACAEPLSRVEHATIEPGDTLIGTTRFYKCDEGFINVGDLDIICMPDARWSKRMFKCLRCLEPPVYKNAELEPGKIDVYAVRRYTCKRGYLATGPITTTCSPPKNKMGRPGWSKPVHYCKDCEEPYLVEHADLIPGPRTIGSLQRYVCKKGYVPTRPPYSRCNTNAEWDPPDFKCIACTGAPEIPHALVVGPLDVTTLIGEARTYDCAPGLVATGMITATCNFDLTWTISKARCKGCENPHPIDFGTPLKPLTNIIGSVLAYECMPNHVPVGKPEVLCLETGEWALPNFKCVIVCQEVPIYENTIVQQDTGHIFESTITFACTPGYLLRGNPTIRCTHKGIWTERKFTCEACVGAPAIPHALPVGPPEVITLIGEARNYICEKGYIKTGDVMSVCAPDLSWEISKTGYCRGCENPHPIDFGTPLKPLTNTVGSILAYQCMPGYEPVGGNPEVVCLGTGQWSIPKFQCVIVCQEVPIYENTIVQQDTGHIFESTITFACTPGYLLRGNPTIRCTHTGFWSKREFTCEACVGAPAIPHALPVGPPEVITLIGEARNYICEKGYIKTGDVIAICAPDLSWEISKTGYCRGCENPLPIDFGAPLKPLTNTVGSILAYQCMPGYEPVGGNPEVVCLKTGQWSIPKFQCVIVCQEVPIYENTIVQQDTGHIFESTITFACTPGYLLRGNPTIRCTHTGFWSKREFTCEACVGTPVIPHALPVGPPEVITLIGEARNYVCEKGFIKTGDVIAVCAPDLSWEISKTGYCRGCENPHPIDFGTPLKPLTNTVGSILAYQCMPGYEPVGGNPEVVCLGTGQWSMPKFQCVIVCQEVPIYENTIVQQDTGHIFESTITFACTPGYLLRGSPTIRCTHTGFWSKGEFTCEACVGAPAIPHALPVGPPEVITLIGEARNYICEKGYIKTGDVMAVCAPDLSWEISKTGYCRGCETPHPIDFGSPLKTLTNTVGSILVYQCMPGYEPVGGNPEVVCLGTGKWSIPKFQCVIVCQEIPIYENTIVQQDTGHILESTITFACAPGYLLRGNPTIRCTHTGFWSKREFTCEACVGAPAIPHALPVGPPEVITLIGEARNYICEKGYIKTGDVMAVCAKDLSWEISKSGYCRGCENPQPIDFGTPLKPLTNTVGSILAYQCMPGHEPVGGNPEVVCLGTGQWSIPKFQCVIVCHEVPIYENTIVQQDTGHIFESTITFACTPGYLLRGNPTIRCTHKGIWSNREFTCEACVGVPALPHALPVGPPEVITLIGEARNYICEKGYIKTGDVMAVCAPDLSWEISKTGYCRGCENPHPIDFGTPLKPLTSTVGSILAYQCMPGYEPVGGNPEVVCLGTGQWSIPKFQCVIVCHEVPIYVNTIVQQDTGHFFEGTITFACTPGYLLKGNPTIRCTHTGFWTKREFTCEACVGAPALPHALPVGPAEVITLIGEARNYICEKGYVKTGDITAICDRDLSWVISKGRCKGCEVAHPVKFGTPIEPLTNVVGSILTYQCMRGHIAVGKPEVYCMENGEWSVPTFSCVIACKKPPQFKDAVPAHVSGYHLKAMATYRCLSGGPPTGNPHLFCLANGHWSQRKFSCGKCGPPPHTATAIPKTMGPTGVGSHIEYICREGFIADGPLIAECLPSEEWALPECRGCGKPPEVYNTYCSMGPDTIGSVRKYECNSGYYMRGSGVIKCLPSGQWSTTQFSCHLITTTTTTTPAPIPTNPSVCDRCRMMNGVGFMNHPTDCNWYVHCHYGRNGGIVAIYQHCQFGLYWSQHHLSCLPAKDVDCPTERCLDRRIRSYKYSSKGRCCAYWECERGKSVAKCCTDGYAYVENKGCQPDPTCSIRECPYEDFCPGCDKRPVRDLSYYEQHVGAGYWVQMPCAPSTAFSMLDCRCSQHTWVDPGFDCRPELHLDFDDGTITDKSGNHLPVYSEGVIPYRGAAYFNGNAKLLINRFSNMAFGGHLVIKFRYKEDLRGSTASSLQALVTNGDCGEDPSIIVAKMLGYVLLGSKTSETKTFAMPVVDSEWKDVTYHHDEEELEGRVCGASYSKFSYGPIRATHCGLQIGYGTKLSNFMGLIDDLAIYTCRPPREVLYSYAYTEDT